MTLTDTQKQVLEGAVDSWGLRDETVRNQRQELAEATGLSEAYIVAALGELETAGLIQRLYVVTTKWVCA